MGLDNYPSSSTKTISVPGGLSDKCTHKTENKSFLL